MATMNNDLIFEVRKPNIFTRLSGMIWRWNYLHKCSEARKAVTAQRGTRLIAIDNGRPIYG